ncbi:MAG: hydroxymethylbilane synthase [Pirellulales bacterium]|nr:hydroxymethylbilane synthase [Pirellulales bacterium]
MRIATRGSRLAIWQAEHVAKLLSQVAAVDIELVRVTSSGDRDQTRPVAQLESQGLFTKEIQQAVLDGRADFAVHSLKDLPTEATPELILAAVPERESVNDVLISRDGMGLSQLPRGARVGTGSRRRRAQLLHVRPDLELLDLRGNVETRLQKLHDGQFEAIVLASAGLKRLGLASEVTEELMPEAMLPAVGQGALGIEARTDDLGTQELLARIDHAPSRAAVTAERTLLAELCGGCLAPVGAWAQLDDSRRLVLDAVVLSLDGRQRLHATGTDSLEQADALGRRVAADLLSQGAAELIAASRDAK